MTALDWHMAAIVCLRGSVGRGGWGARQRWRRGFGDGPRPAIAHAHACRPSVAEHERYPHAGSFHDRSAPSESCGDSEDPDGTAARVSRWAACPGRGLPRCERCPPGVESAVSGASGVNSRRRVSGVNGGVRGGERLVRGGERGWIGVVNGGVRGGQGAGGARRLRTQWLARRQQRLLGGAVD